jgi:carbon-monoxide dehydrogenase medium subunit
MYDFNYHRPTKLDDAVKLLKSKKEGKLMSGGMTLIPTMKQRLAAPSDIIDLSGLNNAGIKVLKSKVTIMAGTTHAEVAGNKELKKAIPALASLAGMIGDPHVRHKGTIGGSVANADPAADYPAALLALNAKIVTNSRTIDADKFFKGLFETALRTNEIIKAVEFQVPEKAAYSKFPNPASRYAMVGVFVADFGKKGVRVGITGAKGSAYRDKAMEKALSADFSQDALANVKVKADDMNSDIHASADYRAHLVSVMAKRAVAAAK